ncbi:hypothetical protein [Acinetobacter calcoaceticus]
MKPEQFIREWDLSEAKRILAEAPESATYYEKTIDGDFYFKYENFNWLCFVDGALLKTYMEEHETFYLIRLDILKRLVESVDRVNSFGGLDDARAVVKMGKHYKYLNAYIRNYESIYGGGENA